MRILLTGPGGFLGSALARHWMDRGHDLWLLARPKSDLSRLGDLTSSVRILRPSDMSGVAAVVRDATPEVVVHTACSYGRKGESVLDLMEANVLFGTVILQTLLEEGASPSRPVAFLNTGTVLETDVSLYALSKKQFSALGDALAKMAPERLRFIDIRMQQMYGPGDDRSKFTTHVIEACRRNETRLLLTAGEQRRDFIFIEDAVKAFDVILRSAADLAVSDVIEIGSGDAITMRSFVELAKQVTGASTQLEFGAVPYRDNEAMLCVANTERLRGLGWQPNTSLAEGLRLMANQTL